MKKYPDKRTKAQRREQKRGYFRRLKRLVIDHYGGKCACCGDAHMKFLTINHIEGGGRKHLKSIKRKGNTFYVWLKVNGWPEGFNVLCMNCNLSMGAYGYCPHQANAPSDWLNIPPVIRRPILEKNLQES